MSFMSFFSFSHAPPCALSSGLWLLCLATLLISGLFLPSGYPIGSIPHGNKLLVHVSHSTYDESPRIAIGSMQYTGGSDHDLVISQTWEQSLRVDSCLVSTLGWGPHPIRLPGCPFFSGGYFPAETFLKSLKVGMKY